MSNNGINSATNGRSGSTSSGSANINLKTKSSGTPITTTSINQKHVDSGGGGGGGGVSVKTFLHPNAAAATTTTTTAGAIAATTIITTTKTTTNSKTLPEKITTTSGGTATQAKQLNNELNKKIATHRRDNSSLGGGQKDVRKFQYVEAQTSMNLILEGGGGGGNHQLEATAESSAQHNQLVYYDGKLNSATLDTLIRHMVPTHDYYPEHNYLFAFLLSARLFIRPHELLAQISQTWERQQQQQQPSQDVVDEAAAAHYAGHHMVSASSFLANSASPLTQRKLSNAASNNVAELEPKQQQRTATQKSAQNCIRLLSEWIETFPYDFRDERLMQQVRILARKCVYIDNSLGKQVSRILQTLVGRLTALEQYEEFLQNLHAANVDLNPNGSGNGLGGSSGSSGSSSGGGGGIGGYHNHGFQPLFGTSAAAAYTSTNNSYNTNANSNNHTHAATASKTTNLINSNSSGGNCVSASTTPQPDDVYGIMDLCPSCAHLAHQLTAIELERLSHIGPEEFVQAFAKEYQHSVTTSVGAAGNAAHVMSSSLHDMKKTRNLESYVEWFNRLSYFTASEIVKYPKKKQRVRIIEYWIETARECFNIGNFNSLMAIIAGLNLAPIARLKKTWSKVQSAKFSVLEHQMDPTSNFNSYRSTLKAAMWRSEGATDERERIIIPFFSLFVKDLYFLNEGCSNRLPNNHINYEKCSQLAKQVMEFNEWKKVCCPFEKLPNVIAYLQHNAVLNENTLSMASFECEPPENTEEKDRYKTVKAETKQQLLQQLQEQQLHQQQ